MLCIRAAMLTLAVAVGCSGGAHEAASQSTAADDDLIARKLLDLPPGTSGYGLAPDARRIATAHQGKLAWLDLQSGAVRDIRQETVDAYVTDATVAPDGARIAFIVVRGEPRGAEVWVADSAGAKATRLHTVTGEHTWAKVGGFSPDGRSVAVLLRGTDWSWQLATVNTRSGEARVLKSLGWRIAGTPTFSPDGAWIAYDYPPSESSARRDLFVIRADGSSERAMTSTAEDERLLGWTDMDGLLFTRDEGGTRHLLQLPIGDGRATGAASVRKPNAWGLEPVGVAGSRIFYRVPNVSSQLHIASAGPQGAAPTAGRQLVETQGNITYTVSDDGAQIAYSHVGTRDDGVGPVTLHIVSAATGERRVIEVPVDYFWGLSWREDGTLLTFAQKRGRNERYLVDLRTGNAQLLPTPEDAWDTMLLRSHGGRYEYFLRRPAIPGKPWPLMQRDTRDGSERVLIESSTAAPHLSPDDRYLAAAVTDSADSHILVVPTEEGTQQSVRVPSATVERIGGWTSDARAVFAILEKGGERALWRVPIDGSAASRVALAEFDDAVTHVLVRRNGEQIFMIRSLRRPAELWVLEPATGAVAR